MFFTKRIKIKAPAKINLFLDVLEREETGYHKILTIFQTISLFDTIIMYKSKKNRIFSDHKDLQGKQNIVEKVILYFQQHLGIKDHFTVRIKKRIPLGAGLAGGSTDAAAVIAGIAKLSNLKLSLQELMDIGKTIGKDVPLFFTGGLQNGENYGEVLKPLSGSLNAGLLIIYPGFEISTKESYLHLDPGNFKKGLPYYQRAVESLGKNSTEIFSYLYNIFEINAFQAYPLLQQIKNDMIGQGAAQVLMSGSGSTMIGFYSDKKYLKIAKKKLKSKYKDIILSQPFHDGINFY